LRDAAGGEAGGEAEREAGAQALYWVWDGMKRWELEGTREEADFKQDEHDVQRDEQDGIYYLGLMALFER
jgi:hypothetical protein